MFKKILSTLSILLFFSSMETTLLEAKTKISKEEIITAIKSGRDSTKNLLKYVPIDYYSNTDGTLLHYAVKYRKRDVVELLVNRKILLSRQGGRFYGTPLQDAIYYGHLGIASYLIDKGTLLNIKDINGDTALHIAARNGYLDIVNKLIAHGASKNSVNKAGETPYDLIPNLSWDSKKQLEQSLLIQDSEQPRFNGEEGDRLLPLPNHRINTKHNNNINIIDKKTTIENTNMGVEIDTNRINQF